MPDGIETTQDEQSGWEQPESWADAEAAEEALPPVTAARPPVKPRVRRARAVPAPEPLLEAEPPAPVEPTIAQDRSRKGGRVLLAFLLLILLLLAAAAGLGAAAYNESRPEVYRSTAVLIIDQEPALTASRDDGLISKLLRLRLKFVDVLSTTAFTDPLAQQLELSPDLVHDSLTATAPPSSLLINVTAQTDDPLTAQQIAQVAAENLRTNLAQQQSAAGVKASDQVTLDVVGVATKGVKTSPKRSRSVLVGASVGVAVLVVGGALIGAARRRRS